MIRGGILLKEPFPLTTLGFSNTLVITMSTDYLILLQRLKTFIRREYETQRYELEKQWALPLAQRIRQGYAIEALSLISLKGNALKLGSPVKHR